MIKPQKISPLTDFAAESESIATVVDFGATYCAPCRQLEPLVAELAAEYLGKVRVVTIDIEDHPELAQRYGVRAVPTLLAFKNGNVVAEQRGFSNPRRVVDLFAELVAL